MQDIGYEFPRTLKNPEWKSVAKNTKSSILMKGERLDKLDKPDYEHAYNITIKILLLHTSPQNAVIYTRQLFAHSIQNPVGVLREAVII